MKRYIKSNSTMSDIQPIADESPEFWALDTKITNEYESIRPKYSGFDKLFYRGRWKNTDNGVQYVVTTCLTPDCPEYDESKLQTIPLEYVYRAVSVAEYEYILKTGQIKSNSSMNIGYEVDKGYTCYHRSFPGWYLPKEGGYILKIKTTPDMFIDDVDEYIKTPKPVSINNIVEVNGIPV